jgi:hypothetical protein
MRLVILESPFRSRDEAQARIFREYLEAAIKDSINRGESPYASHRIIPGALDDSIPAERDQEIRAGYAWWKHAAAIVFYVDHGMSDGMHKALQRAKTMQLLIEMRKINDNN